MHACAHGPTHDSLHPTVLHCILLYCILLHCILLYDCVLQVLDLDALNKLEARANLP